MCFSHAFIFDRKSKSRKINTKVIPPTVINIHIEFKLNVYNIIIMEIVARKLQPMISSWSLRNRDKSFLIVSIYHGAHNV